QRRETLVDAKGSSCLIRFRLTRLVQAEAGGKLAQRGVVQPEQPFTQGPHAGLPALDGSERSPHDGNETRDELDFVPVGIGRVHWDSVRERLDQRAASRHSTTSASLVGEKSSYERLTARKSGGISRQTTSSAISRKRATLSGAPTGTATTIRAGCSLRTAESAARSVAPVARPSSTRITVRPSIGSAARPCRYARSRRSSSRSSAAVT